MSVNQTFFLQGSVSTLLSPHSSVTNCREVSVKFTVSCCSPATYPLTFVNGNVEKRPSDRNEVHLGLPSKGRMAADTLDLLKDCQLSVRQVNPRQYVAEIPQFGFNGQRTLYGSWYQEI
ncbi:hypothetical protein K7X08_009138 [Anisodus acutangulus]|uniref:ATP phosphoribosyltransferase n=1 Tax=Anisodus acutangulus TaxID=402998 RepID=A0A9Q1MYR9_9SOLA|nr:hypothetical protein K7X08_009138 [Anisodus acutangulus]